MNKLINTEVRKIIDSFQEHGIFDFFLIEDEDVNFREDYFSSFYDVKKEMENGYTIKEAVSHVFEKNLMVVQSVLDKAKEIIKAP